MKENMELIKQISDLRKEVSTLNSKLRNQDSKLQQLTQGGGDGTQDVGAQVNHGGATGTVRADSYETQQLQLQDLQIKRQYIDELRKKLNILVEENRYLKNEANQQQQMALAQEQQ